MKKSDATSSPEEHYFYYSEKQDKEMTQRYGAIGAMGTGCCGHVPYTRYSNVDNITPGEDFVEECFGKFSFWNDIIVTDKPTYEKCLADKGKSKELMQILGLTELPQPQDAAEIRRPEKVRRDVTNASIWTCSR